MQGSDLPSVSGAGICHMRELYGLASAADQGTPVPLLLDSARSARANLLQDANVHSIVAETGSKLETPQIDSARSPSRGPGNSPAYRLFYSSQPVIYYPFPGKSRGSEDG